MCFQVIHNFPYDYICYDNFLMQKNILKVFTSKNELLIAVYNTPYHNEWDYNDGFGPTERVRRLNFDTIIIVGRDWSLARPVFL